MAFTASGPLAGIAGLETRRAQRERHCSRLGDELVADVTGRLTDIRSSGAAPRTRVVRGESLRRRRTARGTARAARSARRSTSTSNATGRQQGDGWSGDATLQGTRRPAADRAQRAPRIWRTGPDGWSLDAAFSALRGEIDLDLAERQWPRQPAASNCSNVNLRGLSRLARITPIAGPRHRRRRTSTMAKAPRPATCSLTVADANPVGVTANPVTLDADVRPARTACWSRASPGAGQGFSLDASSRLPVVEGERLRRHARSPTRR